jgi:Flp pilus assembly protein TadG
MRGTEIVDDADRGDWLRQRGQIIAMFAIFSTTMIGVLGLAIDLGFAFSQRRTVQNAADAAALAGARAVVKDVVAFGEANPLATGAGNKIGSTTQTMTSCNYVKYDGASVGDCSAAVPSDARGVRVIVQESHETFFIRVIPGAPNTVTTSATATANVQQLKSPPAAPFILCGSSAWAVGNTTGAIGGTGQTNNILLSDPDRVNPAYIGFTFRVLDSQLSQGNGPNREAGCNLETLNANWNGRAADDGAGNAGRPVPGYFSTGNGTGVGPVNQAVVGAGGCDLYRTEPYNCIMILPIAREETPPKDGQLYVVGFAPFYVFGVSSSGGPCNNNCQTFNATLLDDFLTIGESQNTWCRTCGGVAVIRLTI